MTLTILSHSIATLWSAASRSFAVELGRSAPHGCQAHWGKLNSQHRRGCVTDWKQETRSLAPHIQIDLTFKDVAKQVRRLLQFAAMQLEGAVLNRTVLQIQITNRRLLDAPSRVPVRFRPFLTPSLRIDFGENMQSSDSTSGLG